MWIHFQVKIFFIKVQFAVNKNLNTTEVLSNGLKLQRAAVARTALVKSRDLRSSVVRISATLL